MTVCSCLYEGDVRHRRFEPVEHSFRYRLFMMYVDLDELPTLFGRHWLWSADRPNLAWFRRTDHLGPVEQPLSESVRDLVDAKTGTRPTGPIRLLTQFRYFGFEMNPISLFYCFDAEGRLEFVVAEVNNTPWGEQHSYVLAPQRRESTETFEARAAKEMHVSPFFDMNFDYRFLLTTPRESLVAQIENHRPDDVSGRPAFNATLTLKRRPLTSGNLARALCFYPHMTGQIFGKIYWQAFLLWRRQLPFVPHPQTKTESNYSELNRPDHVNVSHIGNQHKNMEDRCKP